GDGERMHVLAPAGELLFLSRRNQAPRIENDHIDARLAMKSRGHGTAGIAGGRDQNRETRVLRPQADETLGQKPGAEILEGRGGPVKQLESVAALASSCRQRGW